MYLFLAKEGKTVKIKRIVGGRRVILKLFNLGIYEGENIRIIFNSRGPLVISKGNSRVALGRGLAHKIFVEEE